MARHYTRVKTFSLPPADANRQRLILTQETRECAAWIPVK